MKKINLFPAPHVEIKVHVSDEIIKDYKECARLSEVGGDGKDCDSCSWRDVMIFGLGMCELEEMEQLLGGNDGEINTPA